MTKRSTPTVSICIPAYNNAAHLKRTLRSIANQSYADYEVIITDDSNTDGVEKLVAHTEVPSIRYLKNYPRLGSPKNWNACTARARGKYIKIMHHDDWFATRESLQKMVDYVEQLDGERLMVFCASNAISPAGKELGLNIPQESDVETIQHKPIDLIRGNIIGAPSTILYTRRAGISFDPQLVWLVDIDFYIALIKQGYRIGYIPQVLVSTTTGDKHQVTSRVKDDPSVELYENLYIYTKWLSVLRREHFRWIESLLKKYNIRSRADLPDITFSTKMKIWLNIIFIEKTIREKLHAR